MDLANAVRYIRFHADFGRFRSISFAQRDTKLINFSILWHSIYSYEWYINGIDFDAIMKISLLLSQTKHNNLSHRMYSVCVCSHNISHSLWTNCIPCHTHVCYKYISFRWWFHSFELTIFRLIPFSLPVYNHSTYTQL